MITNMINIIINEHKERICDTKKKQEKTKTLKKNKE